ncbi:hypothetical protein ACCS68_14560 [Rhizobium beringeri]|uniref:hypothetical protein n=1 Tax=Rhizobium beringeri TaxID=3019934 RepID=UPI003CE67AA1
MNSYTDEGGFDGVVPAHPIECQRTERLSAAELFAKVNERGIQSGWTIRIWSGEKVTWRILEYTGGIGDDRLIAEADTFAEAITKALAFYDGCAAETMIQNALDGLSPAPLSAAQRRDGR